MLIQLIRGADYSYDGKKFKKGIPVEVSDDEAEYLLAKKCVVFVEGEGKEERPKFIKVESKSKEPSKTKYEEPLKTENVETETTEITPKSNKKTSGKIK